VLIPYGGFVLDISETPISSPYPNRLGLSWDVYRVIICSNRLYALLRINVNSRKIGVTPNGACPEGGGLDF